MDHSLLVMRDGDILVSIDYDPQKTVSQHLDEYAKEYGEVRALLSGVLVNRVKLPEAA
jgi:hypothetical protein